MKSEHDVKHRSSNFMGFQPFQINPFLNANFYVYGFKDQRNIHRKQKIMMLIIAEMQHFLLLYLKNCTYINIIGT